MCSVNIKFIDFDRILTCDSLSLLQNSAPVAVYDGCGSVAFVYWLRLKQYL